jgi:hypothetical protein
MLNASGVASRTIYKTAMIIDLTKDEVRVATQLAIERWLAKWDSVDRPNYAEGKANGKLEHEVLANIRANVCEWAAAKFYNLAWNVPWYPNELHNKRFQLSDIGEGVEVRSVRTRNSVPFWQKDWGKTIVATKCMDEEKFSQVFVFGHVEASHFAIDDLWDESISGWRIPLELFELDEPTP